MGSAATTIDEYLAELPDGRREIVTEVVEFIRRHIPDGYVEAMEFGMPTWVIPLEDYPNTYNGRPLGTVAIANQKQKISLYLMSVYGDDGIRERFEAGWAKSGKKLDMGKSCLRFRTVDDLALDVLAEVIEAVTPQRYIEGYEAARARTARGK